MRALHRFSVRTRLPSPLADLEPLARNLRWSWHAPTRDLFAEIDAERWAAVGGSPLSLLRAVPYATLEALAADDGFVARVRRERADLDRYLTEPRWYQGLDAGLPASVAYFSPEYGLTSALPQYAGGLGILAGDHLKSASDLGVPLTGVGLLYSAGYFRQSLDREGWQVETYPELDREALPLTLLREADGRPAAVTVALPGGRTLHAQVWHAAVGRVPLLLLDSDVPANDDALRTVTDRLYGGAGEHRLQQELLLGVGGVRALRTWSRLSGAPAPEVFHTNEGHAGFLGLERIRELVADGSGVDEALERVRAATVFTTHTPVPAGIDRFTLDLVERHLAADVAVDGVPLDRVLALGAETHPGGDPTLFNMAIMGLRLAGRANGVSLLHGEVSRGMFAPLWPGFDAAEVPITSITNGVHAPTWVDRRVLDLAEARLTGPERESGAGWLRADAISDAELWSLRRTLRAQLVADVRERLRASWRLRGASPAELGWVDDALSPDVLTIGFARRVPTYKRLTLMLRDSERLRRLLTDPERPVQVVVAGKSHPADEQGKRLIQQLVRFSDAEDVRRRIVFLPDYDIAMAQTLLPGCDVWLNNPLRPLEASGTSGMKSALNGGLNLSILDGWWDEWFDGDNGWAIPTADGVGDPDRRDDLEAAALYDLVEREVAARFYERDERGLPATWLSMVRRTLATLGPKVQATRMVTEYVHRLYAPAASAGRALADPGAARELAAWKGRVREQWPHVRVDHVQPADVGDDPQVGDTLRVRAYVSLGTLAPDDVAVQVVHGPVDAAGDLTAPSLRALDHVEVFEAGRHAFGGEVRIDVSGPFGCTVRIVPRHPALSSDAELGLVVNAG